MPLYDSITVYLNSIPLVGTLGICTLGRVMSLVPRALLLGLPLAASTTAMKCHENSDLLCADSLSSSPETFPMLKERGRK